MVLREWKPLGTAGGTPRRRYRLSLVVWSRRSCACCNGRGDVVFSPGAVYFDRGQGTLGLACAGRGARNAALTVPCRVVCGAREKEAWVLQNVNAVLGVQNVHEQGTERDWRAVYPQRGRRPGVGQ
jgi:hypothetical protein